MVNPYAGGGFRNLDLNSDLKILSKNLQSAKGSDQAEVICQAANQMLSILDEVHSVSHLGLSFHVVSEIEKKFQELQPSSKGQFAKTAALVNAVTEKYWARSNELSLSPTKKGAIERKSPFEAELEKCRDRGIREAWQQAKDPTTGLIQFERVPLEVRKASIDVCEAATVHNVNVIQNYSLSSSLVKDAASALADIKAKIGETNGPFVEQDVYANYEELIEQRTRLSGTCTSFSGNTEDVRATENYKRAEEKVSEISKRNQVTVADLKEINRIINDGLSANGNSSGELRDFPIYVREGGKMVNYISPKYVESEMKGFVDWLNKEIKKCKEKDPRPREPGSCHANPLILAAKAYSRLVSIHPFSDGNGRTSRLVMNLVCAKLGLPSPTPPVSNHQLYEKGLSAAVFGANDLLANVQSIQAQISLPTPGRDLVRDLTDFVVGGIHETMDKGELEQFYDAQG